MYIKDLPLYRFLIGRKQHRAPLKGPGEKAFTLEGTPEEELALKTFLTSQLSDLSAVRVATRYVGYTVCCHTVVLLSAQIAVWADLKTLNILVLPYTQFAHLPCHHACMKDMTISSCKGFVAFNADTSRASRHHTNYRDFEVSPVGRVSSALVLSLCHLSSGQLLCGCSRLPAHAVIRVLFCHR